MRFFTGLLGLALCMLFEAPAVTETYDVLIRNGTIYDGSGAPPTVGDVAINGDQIASIGSLENARGRTEIEARGLAVAPGFLQFS